MGFSFSPGTYARMADASDTILEYEIPASRRRVRDSWNGTAEEKSEAPCVLWADVRRTGQRNLLGIAVAVAVAACGDTPTSEGGPAAKADASAGKHGEGLSATEVWGDRVRVLASGDRRGGVARLRQVDGETLETSDEWLCIESESQRFQPAPVCPGGLAPLNSFRSDDRILERPQIVLTDDLQFVVGMVEKGLARVVVEMSSGPPVEAVIVGDDGTFYVAPLARDASPAEVVAYAVSGAELERRDFSASRGDDTDATVQSSDSYIEYRVEEPPPCVEPDVDEARCPTSTPGG